MATIANLIEQQFLHENTVIMYQCDETVYFPKKTENHLLIAKARQKLFEKWHTDYSNDQIVRIPLEFELQSSGKIIYSCILVKADFAYIDILKSEIDRNADNFYNEKFGE